MVKNKVIINNEKWKNIDNYNGKYKISNKGRVKNTENNSIVNQPTRTNGVPYVNLSYNKNILIINKSIIHCYPLNHNHLHQPNLL
jgi:hypothetical protein